MLDDSMEINDFIKIKIIDWTDISKSQYINGVVTSKSISNKRMASMINEPRILLLRDLGEDEVPDLASKIDFEEHTFQILDKKLDEIKPNLVILQQDISVKLMNLMKDKGITVVCNLEEKKIKRLARLTQTILVP